MNAVSKYSVPHLRILITALILTLLAVPTASFAGTQEAGKYDNIMERALKLEKDGNVQGALDLYMQAGKLKKKEAEPLARASILLMIQNRPEEALSTAKMAVGTDPAHRGAWLNKSVIELASGMNWEAIETTDIALKRFPGDTQLMNNRATAFISLRKLREAEQILLEALKTAPEDSSLNYNLACTYALSDIWRTALIYLEKAVKLDPSLKKNARTDPDLIRLRDMQAFKKITSE